MGRKRRLASAGFSLLEMVIVVAVLLVIAGLMVPNLMTTIANYRLRNAAVNVAGILQTSRMRAVHDNQFYAVRRTNWTGAKIAYVDLNGNGSYDNSPSAPDKPEPTIELPTSVTIVTGGGPAITSMSLGWTPQAQTNPPTFGSQGVPCVAVSGVCQRIYNGYLVGYIVYLTDARGAWAAVTVSPAARIKTWTWSGTAWQGY